MVVLQLSAPAPAPAPSSTEASSTSSASATITPANNGTANTASSFPAKHTRSPIRSVGPGILSTTPVTSNLASGVFFNAHNTAANVGGGVPNAIVGNGRAFPTAHMMHRQSFQTAAQRPASSLQMLQR
eukprot:CAMPEP_0172318654 /NCGR_PEP_ID=MMETSP1058-20130122/35481_1 /TAXON_ID=83371 /ORGANISM="Detonula confervacea, Strain CCMP 353" /LENGTH=127 /DNA_ID=CAMNT_0013033533 /DNA_START=53 /DNA_END=433 /DNA_ORIENTATION=-